MYPVNEASIAPGEYPVNPFPKIFFDKFLSDSQTLEKAQHLCYDTTGEKDDNLTITLLASVANEVFCLSSAYIEKRMRAPPPGVPQGGDRMPRRANPNATTKQDLFVRMEAQGEGRPEILRKVFGLDPETASESELHAADCQMYRWRRKPWYDEIWKDEIRRISIAMSSEALKKIKSQIRDDNGWLANKAANDSLTFAKPLIWGEDEKAISVKIEGMPEIGSPDDDG